VNLLDDFAARTAREQGEAMERIARQAGDRAAANGRDRAQAAERARELWHPGCSHEPILLKVAGPHRPCAKEAA
jgi:hypothetical protein